MSRTKNKNSLEEECLDNSLRPQCWEDYIGQEKIKENIKIIIAAAQQRNQALDHLLFYGNSGLGKTTLAYLVAKEAKKNIKTTSAPAIEKAGDLVALLTNLNEGDILFIDEIHRLSKSVEEYLYPAMEDYKINLILGKGPMAHSLELKLPPFTLIGATTRPALLSNPLRNRFGAVFQLEFYTLNEIKQIIKRSANILKTPIEEEAIEAIAKRSRLTPRIANRLLKRVRDFAEVKNKGIITSAIAEEALTSLGLDSLGLETGDKNILLTLINKFNGGPVGLQTLAAATLEEEDTILEIYEPYLIQLGFIERTPRGRIATQLAYKYFSLQGKNKQKQLNI